MQFGQRGLLMYARENETASDQLALKYLAQTGQSAKGMLETFQRFADQQMFMSAHIDPYIQSHPLAADRIAYLDHWLTPPGVPKRYDTRFFVAPKNAIYGAIEKYYVVGNSIKEASSGGDRRFRRSTSRS